MKKNRILIFLSGLIFFWPAITLSQTPPTRLRTAAYWTSPIMDTSQAKSLAKNDLVIVDLENAANNRAILGIIKQDNPEVKLIMYSNPPEIYHPAVNYRPHQERWAKELYSKHPDWLLTTARGYSAVFWPGMRLMNLSADCPRDSSGLNYGQWIADSLLVLLSDTIWDGYFMDNGGGNISWVYQGKGDQIDANRDGLPDKNEHLDSVWAQGVHDFLRRIRQAKGSDFILIANKGSVEFMDVLDGRFFEGFPCDYLGSKKNDGWNQCLDNAKHTGPYTIFQVGNRMAFNANFIDYVAASAALASAYIAVGQDNTRNYRFASWHLGKAKGKWKIKGQFYYREFAKGRIVVNPVTKKGYFQPKK